MKRLFYFFWEVLKIITITAVIVIPIRYFVFQPFFVNGQSMEPNFHTGDYLIIDEISYRFKDPQRGEVIVFKYPQNPSQRYIKRIIGLPGETVEIKDGKVMVYGNDQNGLLAEENYLPDLDYTPGDEKITLSDGEYFVMGDNREHSYDSRRWGVLPEDLIIGRTFLKIRPFTVLAKVELPDY
ncbi:MAG: signal peptidase I [bacterium]